MRHSPAAIRQDQPGAASVTIQSIAEAMTALRIAPLPRNYELVHAVMTGANEALRRDFSALGARPRQADLDDLGLHHRLAGHYGLAAGEGQSEAARLVRGLAGQLSGGLAARQGFCRAVEQTLRTLSATGTSLEDSLRMIEGLQAGLAELLITETAMSKSLDHGITRLERIDRGLQALDAAALQDRLTHLPNRVAFLRRLEELSRTGILPARGALLLAGIDDIEPLRARFGAAATDRLLKRIATHLRKSIKKSDFVARIDADIFALVFSDIDQPDAVAIAERLRGGIAEVTALGGCDPGEREHLTASIGIALMNRAGDAAALQFQAQAALAAAKNSTRQPIQVSLG